jgi:hypothetical protein
VCVGPPRREIDPQDDAGSSLTEDVLRSESELQNPDDVAVPVDEWRSAAAFGREQTNSDDWYAR